MSTSEEPVPLPEDMDDEEWEAAAEARVEATQELHAKVNEQTMGRMGKWY